MDINCELLQQLKDRLDGEFFFDTFNQILYATDASAYREIPIAVAIPKSYGDLKKLIQFAHTHKITLIPRAAGTSLAGQVVGNGIVVDISKHFTQILEINKTEKWVRVQPGVVLDELNLILEPYGLFFGPETSTSNRCMIGGMVGNNSCGAHSLIYGSTRDHLLEVKGLLSDGSDFIFNNLSTDEFLDKCKEKSLEGKIYSYFKDLLNDVAIQKEIRDEFPDPEIKRRNTGYAIDQLLETDPFTGNGVPFNLSKLIAGSEGTLAFVTEIKLNLVPVPPKTKAVICIHLKSVTDALHANLVALNYNPGAIELMDHVILDCTKDNIAQRRNRFFIEGDPGALMIVEFARETREEIDNICKNLIAEFKEKGYGYHFPVLYGTDINKVWALRKSGLGVLSNVPGDAKPVSLVEDTAVHPKYLPEYISDFNELLSKHNLSCVYHAHIATGELHLRPVINLKKVEGVELFYTIARETAKIVKKYRGSLSGEHGDGRLRGEFIPLMVGNKNYQIFKELKQIWDPDNIFNANKIVNTPSMKTMLRLPQDKEEVEIKTWFDFSKVQGILRAAESCNGSGDCRKSEIIGGVMCPSYMATRDESKTTRARANMLREFLTQSTQKNPFDHKELYQVMDLCLSCKGCKSECPSNVDMAKLKAEFLQHWYISHGIPFRTKIIANFTKLNQIAATFPQMYNALITNHLISGFIKKSVGFASKRSLPLLHKQTFRKWIKVNLKKLNSKISHKKGELILFIDEFTNYNDVTIGISTVTLLNRLGYFIYVYDHLESGRTYLSKGLLKKAKQIAEANVSVFSKLVTANTPLIGIEPSCILTFRDEYPELVNAALVNDSKKIAPHCLFIDEFLALEMDKGNITKEQFTTDVANVKLHGHCQQKVIISTECTRKIISFPENYKVTEIKSGCCGMAGSFGYEKEHYDLSMKIGELVLFPEVRSAEATTLISAPGTSCRHQIKDGTGRIALHPVEILLKALK